MKRNKLEEKILEQHPNLKKINLDMLLKEHLEAIIADEEVIISVNRLEKIFLERNEKAIINQRLNNENFGLKAKIDAKIREIANNSEILQAGKWLLNCLSLTGDDRIDALSEKGLITIVYHNNKIINLKGTIKKQKDGIKVITDEAISTIKTLETTIDNLNQQLNMIEDHIITKFDKEEWDTIKSEILPHLIA